jgi:hypothetical protein
MLLQRTILAARGLEMGESDEVHHLHQGCRVVVLYQQYKKGGIEGLEFLVSLQFYIRFTDIVVITEVHQIEDT